MSARSSTDGPYKLSVPEYNVNLTGDMDLADKRLQDLWEDRQSQGYKPGLLNLPPRRLTLIIPGSKALRLYFRIAECQNEEGFLNVLLLKASKGIDLLRADIDQLLESPNCKNTLPVVVWDGPFLLPKAVVVFPGDEQRFKEIIVNKVWELLDHPMKEPEAIVREVVPEPMQILRERTKADQPYMRTKKTRRKLLRNIRRWLAKIHCSDGSEF